MPVKGSHKRSCPTSSCPTRPTSEPGDDANHEPKKCCANVLEENTVAEQGAIKVASVEQALDASETPSAKEAMKASPPEDMPKAPSAGEAIETPSTEHASTSNAKSQQPENDAQAAVDKVEIVAPTEQKDEAKKQKKRLARAPKQTQDKKDDAKKAPKPSNAYMIFYRKEIKKDSYTGMPLPERAKSIGATWRQMGDDERAPFYEQVTEAKQALLNTGNG